MKTDILGINIDVITNKDLLKKILKILYLEERNNKILFTPNPEIIIKAKKDKKFRKILSSADILIPDGIGIVLASKLNKLKIKERVTGCDIVFSIFKNVDRKIKIYILGSKEDILLKAKLNIEKDYKNIEVVGYNDGYFDKEKEKIIIEDIIKLKPDILIVGMGCPKQEEFIYKYKNLPVKLSVAVGGTIDIISQDVKRAPNIFIKLGLEWLYRIIKQPCKILRIITIPNFIISIILYKLKKCEN